MTAADGDGDATFDALFRTHRPRMLQLAYRMLSDFGFAEDVVQESFDRLARADSSTLDDPEGWLVVVTSRLCLDRLRWRRRHRTEPLETAVECPSPIESDPADHLELVERVTWWMHIVLDRLTPEERTAFVLHDVFRIPFGEIGDVLERNPAACRQLASRARRTIRLAAAESRVPVETAMQREIAERFINACREGDLSGLLAVLHPSVDGGGDVMSTVVSGADHVAVGVMRDLGPAVAPTLLHIPLEDRAGIVAVLGQRVAALVVLTAEHGAVVHVDVMAGPESIVAVTAALGLGASQSGPALSATR